IVLFVFGYIGVFFGNLIKSAIARQREFLADASAVQFTRNPAGLAGALKKIGGLTQGSRILSPHAHEASHFYFSTGIKNGFFNMLATHPPLKQRILRLDPSFDGVYPKIEATGLRDDPKPASGPLPDSAGKNFPLSNVAGGSIDPQRFVANIGILTADQIDYAAGLRKELPEKLLEAVREPAGASATVLALLLGHDQSIRNIQLELLRKEAPAAVFDEISKLSDLVRILKPESRIPVVDWAMPALRNLSDNQYNQFRALASALISADRQVDLFEFCIDKMIRSHLDAHFHGPPSTSVKYFRTEDILPEAVSLLTALAWTGQSTMEEASRAFRTGFVQLNLTQKRDTTLAAKEESLDLERMDFTLEKLSRAGPYVKKNLLFACAHTVSSDGKVMDSERELLRAIADSFDLPVPPFVHEMVH
ncbi:MAG: M48 family metalloprotease, partial [Acidobacteriota bacterium]